jgi:hypothetical protein
MGKKRFLVTALSTIVCLGFSPVSGATPIKIGFNAGLVGPENLNVSIGGGGLMDFGFDLGTAGSIHFQPTVELWYASSGRINYALYPVYNYDVSVVEFSINPLGRYYFPVASSVPVKPFAGLGFAVSFDFSTVDQNNPDLPHHYHDNGSDLGFCLSGGIDFNIGSRKAFVEIREKMGDINVFKLLFGMTFPIGRP